MKNAKTFTVVCLLALVIGGLGLKTFSPTRGETIAQQRPARNTVPTTPGTKQSPNPSQAPEHVVYRQFFHHLVALKQRSEEVERQGKSGKALREHYKTKIGLKDKDAELLDQIAEECDRDSAKVDAKAQKLIDATRRRFPNGKLGSVQELPPPPPELKQLQLKRDMIVMRARHRLVTELGAQGFQQIDEFIKLNFARDVQPAAVHPKQSGTSQSGVNQ
jgi:hypothetical protein